MKSTCTRKLVVVDRRLDDKNTALNSSSGGEREVVQFACSGKRDSPLWKALQCAVLAAVTDGSDGSFERLKPANEKCLQLPTRFDTAKLRCVPVRVSLPHTMQAVAFLPKIAALYCVYPVV